MFAVRLRNALKIFMNVIESFNLVPSVHIFAHIMGHAFSLMLSSGLTHCNGETLDFCVS